MKTVVKIVVFVLVVAVLSVGVNFGLFYLINTGFTVLKDGAVISSAQMDWPSVSVINYRHTDCSETISVYKYVGDDVSYYYNKDGRLYSVTVMSGHINRTYSDITDPTQLAVYEPKAKALREQVIREFSTVMPPR